MVRIRIPRIIDKWFSGSRTNKPAEKSAGTVAKPYSQMSVQEVISHNSFTAKENKPVTDRQIIIDSMAVTTMLQDAGYTPIQQLLLLSKIAGTIIGTLPNNTRSQSGAPITKQDLETNFFYECRIQRKIANEKLLTKNC